MLWQSPPTGDGERRADPSSGTWHEQRPRIAGVSSGSFSDDTTKCLHEVGFIVSKFDQLDTRKKRTFLIEGWVTMTQSQPMSTRPMQEISAPPLAAALASVLQAFLTPAVFDGVVRAQLHELRAARAKALKDGRRHRATWIVIRDCGWIVWSLVKWPFVALLEYIGSALSS